MKIGFDNEKYLNLQSERIRERIAQFDNKLYLEFGGKLFDDYHASRVLPGYEPNNKIKLLTELKDVTELIICINDNNIEQSKQLELTIEPRLLQSFKRIRNNTRNGLGIVYVQRESCGGCFNKIPPQRQLDIRMRKKIIVCEYCGRIMIDPELAGVKEEPKHVEAPKRRTRKAAQADED